LRKFPVNIKKKKNKSKKTLLSEKGVVRSFLEVRKSISLKIDSFLKTGLFRA